MITQRLDKSLFYERLAATGNNKFTPIFIDMPLSRDDVRFRLIFSWTNIKPNGEFNPMMSAQLIDTYKQGGKKYIVPDLLFDCRKENTTTRYRLYKYLSAWIDAALSEYKEEDV